MPGVMTEGFLLGFSMGSYCALCFGPLIVPYLLSTDSQNITIKLNVFFQFLFGRLLAYILLAIVAGYSGVAFKEVLTVKIHSAMLIIAAILMIVFTAVRTFLTNPVCSLVKNAKWHHSFPLVTGFILGLNLCPPFIAGLIKVIGMESVSEGIIYFIFLFIGSTLYLLPFPFISSILKSDFFHRLGIYLGFLAGIWFLFQGIMGVML